MERLVPDVEQWTKVATQAKNDLAHEGKTPRQSIDELIAVVQVTGAVVVMNLLLVLGVPGERQREIVSAHPELRQVARSAREHLTAECGWSSPRRARSRTVRLSRSLGSLSWPTGGRRKSWAWSLRGVTGGGCGRRIGP